MSGVPKIQTFKYNRPITLKKIWLLLFHEDSWMILAFKHRETNSVRVGSVHHIEILHILNCIYKSISSAWRFSRELKVILLQHQYFLDQRLLRPEVSEYKKWSKHCGLSSCQDTNIKYHCSLPKDPQTWKQWRFSLRTWAGLDVPSWTFYICFNGTEKRKSQRNDTHCMKCLDRL